LLKCIHSGFDGRAHGPKVRSLPPPSWKFNFGKNNFQFTAAFCSPLDAAAFFLSFFNDFHFNPVPTGPEVFSTWKLSAFSHMEKVHKQPTTCSLPPPHNLLWLLPVSQLETCKPEQQ
jgi:hypothetical protein